MSESSSGAINDFCYNKFCLNTRCFVLSFQNIAKPRLQTMVDEDSSLNLNQPNEVSFGDPEEGLIEEVWPILHTSHTEIQDCHLHVYICINKTCKGEFGVREKLLV